MNNFKVFWIVRPRDCRFFQQLNVKIVWISVNSVSYSWTRHYIIMDRSPLLIAFWASRSVGFHPPCDYPMIIWYEKSTICWTRELKKAMKGNSVLDFANRLSEVQIQFIILFFKYWFKEPVKIWRRGNYQAGWSLDIVPEPLSLLRISIFALDFCWSFSSSSNFSIWFNFSEKLYSS